MTEKASQLLPNNDLAPPDNSLAELDALPLAPERPTTMFEALGREALFATPATMGWTTSKEISLTSTPGDHDHLYADDQD